MEPRTTAMGRAGMHKEKLEEEVDMERLGGEDIGRKSSLREVTLASTIGVALESYDFFLYGVIAALVFDQLFFPGSDPQAATLLAFGTFAAGFLSRPIGGVIFGHLGDRIGRKSMLVITLMIAGIATTLIGLLPTYASIGIWAPILLVTLRLIQGLAVSGEMGGGVIMAVEYAPQGKRGLYGSLPTLGVPLGLMGGIVITSVMAAFLSEEQFAAWGWRVPFLVSVALLAVGLYVRMRIAESPVFQQVRETHAEARMPILDALRNYPGGVLSCVGLHLTNATLAFMSFVFLLSYATQQLGLPRVMVLSGVVLYGVCFLALVPIAGALSDRVGRRPVYMMGAVLILLYAFPYLWLVNTGEATLLWLGFAVAGALTGLAGGASGAYMSELFSTRVRYSGLSLGFQVATVLGGAMAPIVSTLLLQWSGGQTWTLSAYLAVVASITLVTVLLTRETFRSDISA